MRLRYLNPFDPSEPWERRRRFRHDTSSSTSTGSSGPIVPPGLLGFQQQSGQDLYGQLLPNPEQIAPLTGDENALIGELVKQGTNNPLISQAVNQENQLVSGPIGSSPVTKQEENAFNTNVVPQTEQSLALSGSGRGGGDTEALTAARGANTTSALQQEVANRAAAPGVYSSIAGEQNNLAQQGLSAAEIPQEEQQAIYQAQFEDLLRRFGLEQEGSLGLLQQQQNSSGTTTPSIFSLF